MTGVLVGVTGVDGGDQRPAMKGFETVHMPVAIGAYVRSGDQRPAMKGFETCR